MRFLMSIVWLLLGLFVLGTAYGFYRTWETGRSPLHDVFMSGSALATPTEGVWEGTAEELGDVSWKGKKFLGDGKGINVFGTEKKEAYPFTFSTEDSIYESDMKVIRLDYGQKENPFWLRYIVDEMVSVGDNKFLGLVYIRLIPGFPLRMGYFTLNK